MEKDYRIGLLIDFYGSLLTSRQEEALQLYFDEDLSLGEMAETWGISRAAVHDLIHRGLETLENYEEKLGLIKRYQAERIHLEEATGLLDELEAGADQLGLSGEAAGRLKADLRRVGQAIRLALQTQEGSEEEEGGDRRVR